MRKTWPLLRQQMRRDRCVPNARSHVCECAKTVRSGNCEIWGEKRILGSGHLLGFDLACVVPAQGAAADSSADLLRPQLPFNNAVFASRGGCCSRWLLVFLSTWPIKHRAGNPVYPEVGPHKPRTKPPRPRPIAPLAFSLFFILNRQSRIFSHMFALRILTVLPGLEPPTIRTRTEIQSPRRNNCLFVGW